MVAILTEPRHPRLLPEAVEVLLLLRSRSGVKFWKSGTKADIGKDEFLGWLPQRDE